MDNKFALPIQPEALRVIREYRKRWIEMHLEYADHKELLLGEAYPLLRERVDRETLDWSPGDLGESPVDHWSAEYWEISTFMLQATGGLAPWLVRDLESLRERAAAQLSYALVIDKEKIEAYKAAK